MADMSHRNQTLRKPPQLRTIDREWLFERIKCAPREFVFPFSVLFYKRFGQERICHSSPTVFREYVEGEFYELWEDKYQKLFNTRGLVSNPFLTTKIRRYLSAQGGKKNVLTGDYRSESGANSVGTHAGSTKGNKQQDSANSETDNGRQVGGDWGSQSTASAREKGNTSQTSELFTKAPQDPQDLSGYQPSASAQINGGSASGLNNGYMTDMELDSTAAREAENVNTGADNVSAYDHKDGRARTGQASTYGSEWGSNESRDRTAEQAIGHNTTIQNSGTLTRDNELLNRDGFENESIVSLLEQWRDSFKPYTRQFLDEFRTCFWALIEDI